MTNNILTKSIAISTIMSFIAISIVSFSSSVVFAQSLDDATTASTENEITSAGVRVALNYTSRRVNPGQEITFEWSIRNDSIGELERVHLKMRQQQATNLYPEYLQYVPGSAEFEVIEAGATTGETYALPSSVSQTFGDLDWINFAPRISQGREYKLRWKMQIPENAKRGVWTQVDISSEFDLLVGDGSSNRRVGDLQYVDILILPDNLVNQLGIAIEHISDDPNSAVEAGDIMTFQIKLMNEGDVLIQDIDVVFLVPNGRDNQLVEYVLGSASWNIEGYEEAIPDNKMIEIINNSSAKYRIVELNPRGAGADMATITYSLRVKDGVARGTVLQNIVQAYSITNNICDTTEELVNECTVYTNTTVGVAGPTRVGIGFPPVPGAIPGTGTGIGVGTGIGIGTGTGIGVGDTGYIVDAGLPVGALAGWIAAVTALGGSAFLVGRRMMK